MDEKSLKWLAVGALAGAAIVYFGPSMATSARPLVRRGIKAAVKGYMQSHEAIAQFQELAEDAIAEAWVELKSEARAASAPPATEAASVMATAAMAVDKESAVGPKQKRRRRT